MPRAARRLPTLLLAGTLAALALSACGTWAPLPAEAERLAFPTSQGSAPAQPGGALAAELYDRLSPVVAFVETPIGTGSGVLVEGKYLVTNAHVVWPYERIRVVFPDGSEFPEAPVRGVDLLVDLAVIGPLETTIPPAVLGPLDGLRVGSDLYLIGYPGEVERFPRPTISRGLLSRYRHWHAQRLTYLQTDATIAGGQSGGALVTEDGRIVGISGFSFAGAFGLVAAAEDLGERIALLADAGDTGGPGKRALPTEGARRRHTFRLGGIWDVAAFVLDVPARTAVELHAEGDHDVYLAVVDPYGQALAVYDDRYDGPEAGVVTTDLAAPHFVVLGHNAETEGTVRLRSSHPLSPYRDPDDGAALTVGDAVMGSLDHPWDADHYSMRLAEGETVVLHVDSVMIDPHLSVDYVGAREEEVAYDDDSGGGLFGLSAGLVYTADHTGEYLVVVEDAEQTEVGGYVLTVTAP